jgi:DNA-binding response OmpR family regulator
VLVVDDDRGVRQSLARALSRAGFTTREAGDGLRALDEVTAGPPDVVVMEVGLPDLTGVEVVRRLRTERRTVPVCLIAGRDEADHRIAGLAAGADDCVVTPYSMIDLTNRLSALARPGPAGDRRPVVLGDLAVDPGRRAAARRGRDLDLTGREFELLWALCGQCGQLAGPGWLLSRVWGYTGEVDGTGMEVVVGCLRRKLEAAGEPRILDALPGVGYLFRPRHRKNSFGGLSGTPPLDRHAGEPTRSRSAAMKFMMLVCTDTEPETDESIMPDIEEWVAENDARGRRVLGSVLASSTATTIWVRGGELLVSDGPFAETKEVIVGFDIIECADLDEAIEVARAHPMAYAGRIDLRAFADLPPRD